MIVIRLREIHPEFMRDQFFCQLEDRVDEIP
jgi:hypothetical protein